MKTIDSKWVFKIIYNPQGKVLRYKARLARGFKQEHGIDFKGTFAPVVRYDSLRVLLAIVAQEDLELMQFDMQTAFLYGDLEDIYMELPDGFETVENKEDCKKANVVCKFLKSLKQGLKQSSCRWNKKFSSVLKEFNFKEIEAEYFC